MNKNEIKTLSRSLALHVLRIYIVLPGANRCDASHNLWRVHIDKSLYHYRKGLFINYVTFETLQMCYWNANKLYLESFLGMFDMFYPPSNTQKLLGIYNFYELRFVGVA